MILNESTRDNMLLPYVQKMNDAGKEISLGQLKTILLRLLADNAGIHNLSLRSNFYLAGASRYYFNGDLTIDGNVGLLTGQEDNFNEEVCTRLNALINILRNAYIDTVGESFEQPEDFGTLKLGVLLKKYNAKINKELGIETKEKDKKEEDTLDRTPNVGKGYSFDIIYYYSLGTKYNRPTSPGAWCVTYGESHFNHYQRNTNPPSHLVVFRQDEWEEIDRQNGLDKSKWVSDGYGGSPRPHDPYANSLIAYFQSNTSWEAANYNGAPLITSRWNHGSTDTGTLEADRAYSQEEFMKITGVGEDELKRIFEIWKKDRPKKETSGNKLSPEEKKERLDFLRKLKYAQMRANGGENLAMVLEGAKFVKYFTNTDNLNKGVVACNYENNCFIIDKGKIVFDTILYGVDAANSFIDKAGEGGYQYLANSIIIMKPNGGGTIFSIYNYRLHKIMEVEGLTEFVSASLNASYYSKDSEPCAMVFTQRGKRSVMFDSKSGLPIQLPNGRYIFEYCKYSGSQYGVTSNGEYIVSKDIVFIMVDSSSFESYTYSPSFKTFNLFDKENFNGMNEIVYIWFSTYGRSIQCLSIEGNGSTGYWGGSSKLHRYFVFNEKGEQLHIFPNDKGYFNHRIEGIYGNYVSFSLSSVELRQLGVRRVEDKPVVFYNFETKQYAKDENGQIIRAGNVWKTKYKDSNVVLLTGRYGRGNYSLLNLNDLTIHPIHLPSFLGSIGIYENLSTEDFLTFKYWASYGANSDEYYREVLSESSYAFHPRKPYIFISIENTLSDVETTIRNFNVNEAIAIVDKIEGAEAENGINEAIVPINITDIMEMVQETCKIILENKILWKK